MHRGGHAIRFVRQALLPAGVGLCTIVLSAATAQAQPPAALATVPDLAAAAVVVRTAAVTVATAREIFASCTHKLINREFTAALAEELNKLDHVRAVRIVGRHAAALTGAHKGASLRVYPHRVIGIVENVPIIGAVRVLFQCRGQALTVGLIVKPYPVIGAPIGEIQF